MFFKVKWRLRVPKRILQGLSLRLLQKGHDRDVVGQRFHDSLRKDRLSDSRGIWLALRRLSKTASRRLSIATARRCNLHADLENDPGDAFRFQDSPRPRS
jgi:hypothetical protein